jgi:outer membrane receptor protein involved in Fe transport
MRYTLPADVSVYGGVNNLTDEGPGIDSLSHPVSPIGRTYYLGVRADF